LKSAGAMAVLVCWCLLISTGDARAARRQELIYVSDEYLQELIRCSWGGYCNANNIPIPIDHLKVDSSGLLFAVFLTSGGVDRELRPMYYPPTPRTLDQFQKISYWAKDKNFSFTDILRYSSKYLAQDQLYKARHVKWGAAFAEILKSNLLDHYRFQDPRQFFAGEQFEVGLDDKMEPKLKRARKAGSWYLPEWIASIAESQVAEAAWMPSKDRKKTYYLLLREDGQAVRVLELESHDEFSGGLAKIYEYGPSRTLTIFQPIDLAPRNDSPIPFASGALQSLHEQQEGDAHPAGSDLPVSGWGAPPPETWPGPKVAVSPYEFFFAQGHAFETWKNRFFAAQRQGRYTFSPDHSWSDEWGNRFYVIADPLWSNWRIFTPRPSWYLLEYRPRNNKTFGLSRVYAYDERWVESIFVPPKLPSLPEAPREISWWRENGGQVQRITIEVIAVLLFGGLGLLYVRATQKR
jgi:hypothetical protein